MNLLALVIVVGFGGFAIYFFATDQVLVGVIFAVIALLSVQNLKDK
jgi:hypothetical protein